MKTNVNSLTPGILIYPGEYLLDELEARGIKQKEFAKLIGMQPTQLNEIIKGKGKRAINAETALLFEKSLQIPADFWLNLQKNFELEQAKVNKKTQQRLEALEVWAMGQPYIASSFFKKQNIIDGDPLNDIPIIKQIYHIDNFEQLAQINANANFARFKKSTVLDIDRTNLIGWVKLVEYRANQAVVVPFNKASKESLIEDLKKAILKNDHLKENVQTILNNAGIKVIYQEKGEKTPVDGISFWSEGNPAIGMSLRYNRVDNFAFVLFHELGHIFLHLTNNNQAEFIDVFDLDDEYSKSPEEEEANQFAQEVLIPADEWSQFFHPSQTYTDPIIKKFAKKLKLHPSVVYGRICHDTKNYKRRTKIKSEIN